MNDLVAASHCCWSLACGAETGLTRARLDDVSSAYLAGWLAQTPFRTRDGALVSKVVDAFRVGSTRAGGLA